MLLFLVEMGHFLQVPGAVEIQGGCGGGTCTTSVCVPERGCYSVQLDYLTITGLPINHNVCLTIDCTPSVFVCV